MTNTVTSSCQHLPPGGENHASEPFAPKTDVERRDCIEECARPTPSTHVVVEDINSSVISAASDLRRNLSPAESEFLYKELKHRHTNILARFIILILCTLVPSIFLHSTVISTTQWFVMSYKGQFRSLGVFSICLDGIANICLNRGGSLNLLTQWNSLTSENTCMTTLESKWYCVAFMCFFACAEFVLVTLTVLLAVRMAFRPTRCKTALAAMCTIGLSVLCGIITSVLFYFFIKCQGDLCSTLNQGEGCTASYYWGYNCHIAATSLDFVAFVLCVFLHTYPHSFRVWAEKLLVGRQERLDRARSRYMTTDAADRSDSRKKKKTRRYLTAADLGMTIEGASPENWVYDVHSDYFYCFELDAFWDPLSREYFCRTLQIWQTTPDGLEMYRNLTPSRRVSFPLRMRE